MLTNDLINKILIEPARIDNGNTIYIVSGYASPNMLSKHLELLKESNRKVFIKLIIGMVKKDGLTNSSHELFKTICNNNSDIECHYLVHNYSVHSKVYSWFSDSTPIKAFIGSGNYSQNAFYETQRDVFEESDAYKTRDYYFELLEDSLDCRDRNIIEHIALYENQHIIRDKIKSNKTKKIKITNDVVLEKVQVSFLDKKGNLPEVSGLNWGQRDG